MFRFKEFSIRQERCAMKVGTDGVLLGAWSRVRGCEKHILDIGSGTGIVSLMLSQRSQAQVTGVEIDRDSYEESIENINASPWTQRVHIVNCAIQEFAPDHRYELIVSNPPFFRSSLKSPDSARSTARHSDSLELKELIKAVSRLLSEDGVFSMVMPLEESRSFDIESCGKLYLTRRCAVITQQGKPAKRYLSEYQSTPCTEVIHEELILRNSDEYSEEYKRLTSQFYTNF